MLPDPLIEVNQTQVDYPRMSTVAGIFMERAAAMPDALAVVCGDVRLSYGELDARSNRLARRLQAQGVGPDTLVGVGIERSETMLVAMLAVLKAGGAYVPLDLTFPPERLAWMIEDSGLATILTSATARLLLPANHCQAIELDTEAAAIAEQSAAAVESRATARNLAYVIYTSGSTGKPKGVMIENRNVVNFFTGMDGAIGCAPGVWLAVTSISFDISVLELLWTITRGFTVVIHAGENGAAMGAAMERYGVTHLQMTPSLARILTLDQRAYAALGQLKLLLLGGEAVPAALIRHLRPVCKGAIYNMYGPTETTIWSTTQRVEQVETTVPIGRPIANTQVYVVDEQLAPVAMGEAGELLIGGDGVVRGYWRRPELTAERFVVAPGLGSEAVYRTGDLARLMPDGTLEYLGRTDFQVKIRGHRIELGEIEALLEQCEGVRQAVVVVREDKADDKRLTAYVVGAGPVDTRQVRTQLAARLPEYMVPSAVVMLESLPLTANGKADRKALLALPAPHGEDQPAVAALPESELERLVARVWQDALGLKTLGREENFFDLGAHSLTVAEVQAALKDALGREIELVDLFQFTTVAKLAQHLAGNTQQSAASERAQRRRMARQG